MRTSNPGTMCHPGVPGHPVPNLRASCPQPRPFHPTGSLTLGIPTVLAHLNRSVVFVTLLVGLGLAGLGLAATAL